jgi:hypothetical protein
MRGFNKSYWDKNYSEPESMDGIGNAKDHVRYLKALLKIEHVDVSSIIDLGFGYGHLFKEMLMAFKPHTAVGIEPSSYAFKKVLPSKIRPVPSTKLKLYQQDLITWSRSKRKPNQFDLGICTSVFQYLSDQDLEEIIPVIANRVKFLYLTVPTNEELKRQVSELEFKDEYALHRTRKHYQKLLSPHFTFISSRFLESKIHFNEHTTHFSDLLFRF